VRIRICLLASEHSGIWSDVCGFNFSLILGYSLLSSVLSLHDSSVGKALGYELDYWGSRVRFPAGAGNFSLHNSIQNGLGAHPAPYPMGSSGLFPAGKAAGA
jgi:hypothetical protein